MQIHLARSSEKLGVFSLEEVVEGLRSGRFLPTDQAWREGMATWAPLGQWQEFQAVAPASPDAAAVAPSQVPWEQGRSVGGFFATIKAALVSPRETFAHARMDVGDWLVFSYFVHLLALPFRVVQEFVYEDINVQLLRFFEKFDTAALEPLLAGLRQNAAAVGTPAYKFMKIGSLFGYLLVGPLMVALLGCLVWVGLWIIRQKVDFGRCVAAALMATSVGAVVLLPLALLAFSAPLMIGVYCLAIIPYLIVYSRAHGAGIQRSPWVSFGAHAVMYLLLVCCCGVLIGLAAFAISPVAR